MCKGEISAPPWRSEASVTPFTALDCSADTCLAGERPSDFFGLVSNSWVNVLTSTTINQLNFPLNADMTGIVIASQPLALSDLRQAFLSLIVLKVIENIVIINGRLQRLRSGKPVGSG